MEAQYWHELQASSAQPRFPRCPVSASSGRLGAGRTFEEEKEETAASRLSAGRVVNGDLWKTVLVRVQSAVGKGAQEKKRVEAYEAALVKFGKGKWGKVK